MDRLVPEKHRLCALLVDDEPFVLEDLRQLLSEHQDIYVCAQAQSLEEARAQLLQQHFDVIFLDVQLRGGSGFELLPQISADTAVIFVTAFDQYAVRAFSINALDYLLKPVEPERLRLALDRLRGHKQTTVTGFESAARLEQHDSIFIKTDKSQLFVELNNIVALCAYGGNYSSLFTLDGKEYLTRRSLKSFLSVLPENLFMRVHRQSIVNLKHVLKVESNNGQYLIYLRGMQKTILASRRLGAGLKNWMHNEGKQQE